MISCEANELLERNSQFFCNKANFLITFKQIQALYWTAELGGFDAAAEKLHTTRSAISKRIQEVEEMLGVELFDRSKRAAFLTPKGEEMRALAEELLRKQETLMERMTSQEILIGRLRIGVTDLTAMTWLANWTFQIRKEYPSISLDVQVVHPRELLDGLLTNKFEMVVSPVPFLDLRLTSHTIGNSEGVWACRRGLVPDSSNMELRDLRNHKLILHSYMVERFEAVAGSWLKEQGELVTDIEIKDWRMQQAGAQSNVIVTENLHSLIAMVMAGMGVGILPKYFITHLLDSRIVECLDSLPKLPPTAYSIVRRLENNNSLLEGVSNLAKKCCDFSSPYIAS
ncbi:LysR family transcriptional regulator [Collimonas pratensis]|uniref:Bacterial regulatory helix-turn-helix, lysR family protein n=1 Tax=Collimonas pratensis TaxID=279113 RepID=A0A127Q6R4_9BURK|nr:LysR family transcriptional regulator [Collimonas pratensis]AMP05332.1 bacterial regulatory helix-turn-helix, lysR family protein [Collimonas pratensis]